MQIVFFILGQFQKPNPPPSYLPGAGPKASKTEDDKLSFRMVDPAESENGEKRCVPLRLVAAWEYSLQAPPIGCCVGIFFASPSDWLPHGNILFEPLRLAAAWEFSYRAVVTRRARARGRNALFSRTATGSTANNDGQSTTIIRSKGVRGDAKGARSDAKGESVDVYKGVRVDVKGARADVKETLFTCASFVLW
eukprot:1194287-Prorocentrum_minimum.AAC.4